MNTFSVKSTVKKYPKKLPLADIKKVILGPKYDLSLVFVGKKRAATLNQKYRSKTYTPNVLSFPLTDEAGEMFICPEVAPREASEFGLSVNGYLAYLFIHGLLHLKGHDHGKQMDNLEKKYLKKFNIK